MFLIFLLVHLCNSQSSSTIGRDVTPLECKCEDIFIEKSSCARAYLEGGCGSCGAAYINMKLTIELLRDFPKEYSDKVESLILRKGCNLTLFEDDKSKEGRVIYQEIVNDFQGVIGSYKCDCNDSKFIPRTKRKRLISGAPYPMYIPPNMNDLVKVLSNDWHRSHPGLRAAYLSLKSGRSSKNAYILVLGESGSAKSTTINQLFDQQIIPHGNNHSFSINEYRIPMPIDEIGVANSELRIINTPGIKYEADIENDARILASLDNFLSNHEELHDRIPNVVLIFYKFNSQGYNNAFAFKRLLRSFDLFRKKIMDENYSNVIFILTHFCSERRETQERPESRLAAFKKAIEIIGQFPRPIHITVAEKDGDDCEIPMVNGFYKLRNGEFYPKNIFEKLELITAKGRDPMGQAVFTKAFRQSEPFKVRLKRFPLIEQGDDKVLQYLQILNGTFNSEMSLQLRHAWHTKVNKKLKRRFPDSLENLQKALFLRNITISSDLPETTQEIVDLFKAIPHDEATISLMKEAFGIQSPHLPVGTVAGYGYNLLNDSSLPKSPFLMEDLQVSDIGFQIPKFLSCKIDPVVIDYFEFFQYKQKYIEARFQSLGVDGSISRGIFKGDLKPGYNIDSISFGVDSCFITSKKEIRLFKLNIPQLNIPQLTSEFEEAIKSLPPYNQGDPNGVQAWRNFFEAYGTHVVRSAYGGGAIELQLEGNASCETMLPTAHQLFNVIQFDEEAPSTGTTGRNLAFDTKINISSDNLKYVGGESMPDLEQVSYSNFQKLLMSWKKSLKYLPTILTTEMELIPMSRIARKLGRNYSMEIERATSHLFNSSQLGILEKRNRLKEVPLPRDQIPDVRNLVMPGGGGGREMRRKLQAVMERVKVESWKGN